MKYDNIHVTLLSSKKIYVRVEVLNVCYRHVLEPKYARELQSGKYVFRINLDLNVRNKSAGHSPDGRLRWNRSSKLENYCTEL